MQVSVTFRHMEPVAALRNYAQAKISKLKRFLDHPLEAKVVLAREKHRQRAEVTLAAHQGPINACGVAEDIFGAIDLVIEKLERQVLKKKEKVKRPKLHSGLSEVRWRLHDNGMEASAEGAERKIIKKEKMPIEPMSISRAAMKMDFLDNDFLIFTNADNKNLNIIYRRRDGLYGLIEA